MASPTLATPELLPSSASSPKYTHTLRFPVPQCLSLPGHKAHPQVPPCLLQPHPPCPLSCTSHLPVPKPHPSSGLSSPLDLRQLAPATRPQVPAMSAPASPTPLPLFSPPRNPYPPKSVVPQTPPALYVYPLCSFAIPHPFPCCYHLPCLEGLFPSPPREPYSSLKSQHQCPFLQEAFPDAFREDTASSSSESSRLAISPPGHGWAHVQAIFVLGALLSSGNLGKCGVNGE